MNQAVEIQKVKARGSLTHPISLDSLLQFIIYFLFFILLFIYFSLLFVIFLFFVLLGVEPWVCISHVCVGVYCMIICFFFSCCTFT